MDSENIASFNRSSHNIPEGKEKLGKTRNTTMESSPSLHIPVSYLLFCLWIKNYNYRSSVGGVEHKPFRFSIEVKELQLS